MATACGGALLSDAWIVFLFSGAMSGAVSSLSRIGGGGTGDWRYQVFVNVSARSILIHLLSRNFIAIDISVKYRSGSEIRDILYDLVPIRPSPS